jgi:hypothetical protein
MLGTLIGLDRHIGQETSEEEIVNNIDKKKEYDKEIIRKTTTSRRVHCRD